MNTVTISLSEYETLNRKANLYDEFVEKNSKRLLYNKGSDFSPPRYLTVANSTDEVLEAIRKVEQTWIKLYDELLIKLESHNKKTFYQRLFNSKINW